MEQNLQLKFQLHYQFRILDTSLREAAPTTGSVRVWNFGLKAFVPKLFQNLQTILPMPIWYKSTLLKIKTLKFCHNFRSY